MSGIFGMIGAAAGLGPKKPKVPEAPVLDAQAAQKQAISGNLEALPKAQELASNVNLFNQQELEKMLSKAIPNYGELKTSASANILSMLKGELPSDVINSLGRAGAERAVASGTTGSEFAAARTARDFGLTSLALTEKGLDAANRWIATAGSIGTPRPYDPTTMFVSPADQLRVQSVNAENKWNRDWLENQQKAQPSYLEQQAMGTLEFFDQLGQTALGGYLGSVTGGVGGKPWSFGGGNSWSGTDTGGGS